MSVLLAAMAAAGPSGALPLVSGPAGAHDRRIPNTVPEKGERELQAGTPVREPDWAYPADGGLCADESTTYRARFPEADRAAAGAKPRAGLRGPAPRFVRGRRLPGGGRGRGARRPSACVDGSLERVVRDGRTAAWDAASSLRSPGRDYYLGTEGHWQDREGCGADQFAHWSFHVKTRSGS